MALCCRDGCCMIAPVWCHWEAVELQKFRADSPRCLEHAARWSRRLLAAVQTAQRAMGTARTFGTRWIGIGTYIGTPQLERPRQCCGWLGGADRAAHAAQAPAPPRWSLRLRLILRCEKLLAAGEVLTCKPTEKAQLRLILRCKMLLATNGTLTCKLTVEQYMYGSNNI